MRICSLLCMVAVLAPSCSLPRETQAQDALRKLAQRVEPNGPGASTRGHGASSRLAHYIRCFRDATFQDARIFAFHVEASTTARDNRSQHASGSDEHAIVLTGYAEFPELRDALIAYLRHLGFETIHNRIELLPSKSLRDRRFALVTASHALIRVKPDASSETATDALLGEPLFLLREADGGFLLCHTVEGYLGYIHKNAVVRVDANQFHRFQAGKQATMRNTVNQKGQVTLPVGARLKWLTGDANAVILELPGRGEARTSRASVRVVDDETKPRVEQALATARQFLGTPYAWGGKTVAGIDCSGLVQTSYAASGVNLARDANQQVLTGRLVATRWYRQDLRPGDTIYFLGQPGKITHAGIYLGDGQYIEAVRPTVRVSSLNPGDANYSPRGDTTFAFAKRLID